MDELSCEVGQAFRRACDLVGNLLEGAQPAIKTGAAVRTKRYDGVSNFLLLHEFGSGTIRESVALPKRRILVYHELPNVDIQVFHETAANKIGMVSNATFDLRVTIQENSRILHSTKTDQKMRRAEVELFTLIVLYLK